MTKGRGKSIVSRKRKAHKKTFWENFKGKKKIVLCLENECFVISQHWNLEDKIVDENDGWDSKGLFSATQK